MKKSHNKKSNNHHAINTIKKTKNKNMILKMKAGQKNTKKRVIFDIWRWSIFLLLYVNFVWCVLRLSFCRYRGHKTHADIRSSSSILDVGRQHRNTLMVSLSNPKSDWTPNFPGIDQFSVSTKNSIKNLTRN